MWTSDAHEDCHVPMESGLAMTNFTNQLIRKCQAAAVAVEVTFLGRPLTFLVTLPALMQDVQTLNFLGRPFTKALTGCKLGYQRREVLLLA